MGYGIDLTRGAFTVRHSAKRAWTLYRAFRALRHVGGCARKAAEVIVGHVVNFFMLRREGLVALRRLCSLFERGSPQEFVRFSASVIYEVEILLGLIFACSERRIDFPPAPIAYIGDASKKGYSFAASQVTHIEALATMQYKEKWRFVEEEPRDATPITMRQGGSWEAFAAAAPHFAKLASAMADRVHSGGRWRPLQNGREGRCSARSWALCPPSAPSGPTPHVGPRSWRAPD